MSDYVIGADASKALFVCILLRNGEKEGATSWIASFLMHKLFHSRSFRGQWRPPAMKDVLRFVTVAFPFFFSSFCLFSQVTEAFEMACLSAQ